MLIGRYMASIGNQIIVIGKYMDFMGKYLDFHKKVHGFHMIRKKSCTTLDGWEPINNGINLSTGAGFLPSTVCSHSKHCTLEPAWSEQREVRTPSSSRVILRCSGPKPNKNCLTWEFSCKRRFDHKLSSFIISVCVCQKIVISLGWSDVAADFLQAPVPVTYKLHPGLWSWRSNWRP